MTTTDSPDDHPVLVALRNAPPTKRPLTDAERAAVEVGFADLRAGRVRHVSDDLLPPHLVTRSNERLARLASGEGTRIDVNDLPEPLRSRLIAADAAAKDPNRKTIPWADFWAALEKDGQ